MKISDKGIEFIKKEEGFVPFSYEDLADVWTIGYGTTVYPSGIKVREHDVCTEEQAELWLRYHIMYRIEKYLNLWIKKPITQSQYDAIVSLCYNIGIHAFHSSTLLKTLNRLGYIEKDHLTRWNKVTMQGNLIKSTSLENRRNREWDLYNADKSINT